MKRSHEVRMNCSRIVQMTMIMASMVLSQSLLFSLEPPAKGELKRLAAEGKLEESKSFARELGNHKASPQLVSRFQYRYQRLLLEKRGLSPVEIDEILAPPPAWQGMPTTGNVKILTLLIDFSDTPHIVADTHAAVDSKIFGDGSGGAPYDSLRNFYRRSSYNLLEIGGNVLGWYTTAYPRSSVTQSTSGRQALIKEALNYYNGLGHDFSQYDNDGDGAIDYLAVVWAGAHGAWASFWWGYQTSFSDGSYLLDGKRLSSYSWQWESYSYPAGSFSPSVLIHETGHALGLPDLYDYDDTVGPDGGVGGLDQMDSTGDHNAFSKWMMEWLTPTAVSSGTQTVTLAPSASSPQAAIFMPTASSSESFAEFFMVQNRYRTGNDTPFPTNGLVIWHVDARLSGGDFLYDNSYTAHKLVRLMEADGLEEIETSSANADAGDYYPQGGQFGPGTMPSSAAYSGLPTAMGVRTITAPGLSQSCEIYRFVDDTPPTGTPTAPVDEGTTIGRTRLVFTWTQGSAVDLESGIAGYNLRVGTSPGGNNLFQGTVGSVLTYAVSGAVNGSTYYASVQAVNGLGAGGSWSPSSDGIRVELPSLAEALDTTGLDWATSGNAAWIGQTGTFHDGVDAAQSPALGNNQSATFQTTVTGPGNLTFYWKVSSEQGYDYLTFYLDGVEQFKISGEVNWTQRSVTIPAGSHVARWTYAKDSYVAEGQDLAWVDQVVAPGGGANPTISGTILLGSSPLAGVVLSGLTGNPATNLSGVYSATVTSGWSGTVTPTLAGYTFVPANRVYANVTVNQTAQDYAATLIETVSTPTTPAGPASAMIATSCSYATGGATSNLGHAVEYYFDWDDGTNSGWRAVGITSASKSWSAPGTYDVRAKARCATHNAIESQWSPVLSVIIYDGGGSAGLYNSPTQYKVLPEVIWSSATGGGTWMSSVQVTDVSGGSVVSVYYNMGTTRRGPFQLWDNSFGNARSNIKFTNLLQAIDDLDSESFTYYGTVGSVEFITQDGSHLLQVAARTLNGNYSKTFTAVSLHDANTADTSKAMIVANLTNNASYRSTAGFFNPTTDSVTVEFTLLDAANSQVGSQFSRTLAGHEFQAFNPFIQAGVSYPGNSYDNVILQVRPTSGAGKVLCFGASVNNTTNDPAAHVAVQGATGYDNGPGSPQILPEAIWATATGGGTWVSEVQIVDATGGSVVSVYFNYGGGSRRGPFTLWTGGAAGTKVKYANILQQIGTIDDAFAYYGKVGAVEFHTQDGSHAIVVTARTLNGNYSKTFPGLNVVDAETADTGREMLVLNYTNDSSYRSTCGFFNPTADAVTVEFTLRHGGSGWQIGSQFSKTLVGHDFQAFNPFVQAGVPYPGSSYDLVILQVRPTSGTGKVICFGATVDNTSNDPASHLAVQGQ